MLFSSVAYASPPERERTHVDVTFVGALSRICGFTIMAHWSGDLIDTTFFDSAGQPIRSLEVGPHFVITWTNPATGKSLTTQNPVVVQTTFNPDGSSDVAFNGLVYRLAIPGQGLVAMNSGRQVLHIPVSGPATVLQDAGPNDGVGPVCDYLRG